MVKFAEGTLISQKELDIILPHSIWKIASNYTGDQWNERFERKYAEIYYDVKQKCLRGIIYSTYKKDSPWEKRDEIRLHFNDPLLTQKDLSSFKSKMGKSFQGTWSTKWSPRWRIFFLNPKDDETISVNGDKAKLSDIFRVAKKDPYVFLDADLRPLGIINYRFLR